MKLWLLISTLISLRDPSVPLVRALGAQRSLGLECVWERRVDASSAPTRRFSSSTSPTRSGSRSSTGCRRMPIKAMSDVTDNSFYWYFMVRVWMPIYLIVYVGPYVF